jgi:four helix bundle protein
MNANYTYNIQTFRDLDAWKLGHELVLKIYSASRLFPKEEMFGLTSQLRRSSVSITSNIAEGFGRDSFKDKIHFYVMARGSLTELQNQLIIAKGIEILPQTQFEELEQLSIEAHKVLNGLIRSLRNRPQ